MKNDNDKSSFERFCDENEDVWSPYLIGIRKGAEANSINLKWDEDWMPVLFIDGTLLAGMPGVKPEEADKEGRLVLGLVGIDMSNGQEKDRLAEMLFELAIITKATGMAMLQTAWMSIIPNVKQESGESEEDFAARCEKLADARPMPRNDPNRFEKLWIVSYQYGGQDDGCKVILADIKREKDKPPVLHNWKIMPAGALDMMGRFPEAIEGGMKIAARIREGQGKIAGR